MLPYKNYFHKIELLKSNSLSLIENVKNFLLQIEKNKKLNAFNFVFKEDALAQAKIISEKIKSGNCGRLAGMVIAIKDVLAIKDRPLTCSSKILSNFISLYTATSIQKLIDEDAIIIGKTNCDEFAMGSSNENTVFGAVLNPYDNSRVAGGSSGGSAVAVSANLCDVAIGTDTGGSIRQPASFCGVYGIKPTYSRVSRFGLTAFASSFDTIGPFANCIEDIALVLEIISGKDKFDSTSSEIKIDSFSENFKQIEKLKIGIPREYFTDGLSIEIKEKINIIIDKLKANKFKVIEISLPNTEYSIATYYILTTAEASSNLARYDGTRYGFRSESSSNLQSLYRNSRSEAFGNEVKRRIMLGTYVLSSGYYDQFYRKAQKVRRLIKQDFENAFEKVDLILTPTTPTTAFKVGEKSNNPLEMYLSDIYTTSANLSGVPSINIPIGKDSKNLPIGIQLLANHFDELKLLQLSYFIQENLI